MRYTISATDYSVVQLTRQFSTTRKMIISVEIILFIRRKGHDNSTRNSFE
jgi:hypothetical protein